MIHCSHEDQSIIKIGIDIVTKCNSCGRLLRKPMLTVEEFEAMVDKELEALLELKNKWKDA